MSVVSLADVRNRKAAELRMARAVGYIDARERARQEWRGERWIWFVAGFAACCAVVALSRLG